MKSLINKFSCGARAAIATVVCGFVAGTQMAYASGAAGIIDGVNSGISGLAGSIMKLLKILLAIGALVSLFMVIYNIFKQERDAAQKAIWWVVGLAAGYAAIEVVGRLINAA